MCHKQSKWLIWEKNDRITLIKSARINARKQNFVSTNLFSYSSQWSSNLKISVEHTMLATAAKFRHNQLWFRSSWSKMRHKNSSARRFDHWLREVRICIDWFCMCNSSRESHNYFSERSEKFTWRKTNELCDYQNSSAFRTFNLFHSTLESVLVSM